VNPMRHKIAVRILGYSAWAVLFVGVALAVTSVQKIPDGQKAKIKGTIQSRTGDLMTVKDEKTGSPVVVDLTDDTKIERTKGATKFFRHTDMDMTAMLPGLAVESEGVGNPKGQLVASKVKFNPDEFAIEIEQQKEINANKAAAGDAQTTANQGVAEAGVAQSSANQAQSSANQAGVTAQAAGTVALINAADVQMVNQRVSDLDQYNLVAEAGIFYPVNGYALDDAAKADLDKLASIALPLQGYMIEIAGYASKTGTKEANQQLSEERANAVAQYLRNQKNIPMRRMLAPAGYGSTHPDAPNSDALGRDINRRVDVKVLVNKAAADAGE
jgi:outer membrane protein OmpA-like peptidoglycan-associated protein